MGKKTISGYISPMPAAPVKHLPFPNPVVVPPNTAQSAIKHLLGLGDDVAGSQSSGPTVPGTQYSAPVGHLIDEESPKPTDEPADDSPPINDSLSGKAVDE